MERFPWPGQMLDVGGHRLHLDCLGGWPVVVLESGFGIGFDRLGAGPASTNLTFRFILFKRAYTKSDFAQLLARSNRFSLPK